MGLDRISNRRSCEIINTEIVFVLVMVQYSAAKQRLVRALTLWSWCLHECMHSSNFVETRQEKVDDETVIMAD